MKVPLLDLKPQYAQIKEKVIPEIMEVIENQAFILGPKVEKMEEQLAKYIDSRFAVGVSSGTDAILLALMALEIGPGDEVITTPYTFFATAGCVARVGAKAVFVDIDPDTYNIDPSRIEKAITSRTKAILPVHLYGQCAEMKPIMKIAEKHKIPVIEDAAQAIGSKYEEKQAGSMGTMGCFSFFPSKNLGCFGDGGLVTTNDEKLAQKLKALRVHGGERQYYHTKVGMNGRLDALQAAVISVKIPHLSLWTEGRRRNAENYDRLLGGNPQVKTPIKRDNCYHIFNQYIIRAKNRDELKAHLTANQIGCAIYYPLSLHEQECFRPWGYKTGDFPVSEEAAKTTLALPVYSELPIESVEFVAKTINDFTAQKPKEAGFGSRN